MSSVSDFIEMSEGEVTVHLYGPFRMSYPQKSASYLALTNKRLIIFAQNRSAAKEGAISLTAETNINHISGIESRTISRISFPAIIAGLSFIIVAAYLYFRPYSSAYAAIENITPSLLPVYILPLITGIILITVPPIISKGKFEFRINHISGENNTSLLSKGIIFHDTRKISEIAGDIGAAVIKIQENSSEFKISGEYREEEDDYPEPLPVKIPDNTNNHTETADNNYPADDDYPVDDDELNRVRVYRRDKETYSSVNEGSDSFRDSIYGEEGKAEEEDDYIDSLRETEEKSIQKDDYLF